jgi:hypothetical protein
MAWSTLPSYTDGNVLTAAQVLAIRDNINETAPAKFTAAGQILVSTTANSGAARAPYGETYTGGGTDVTNSTSYVGLTGSPSFGVTTGTKALVMHGAQITVDTAGSRALASYEISSATTAAAADTWAVGHDVSSAGRIVKASFVYMHTVTAGSNIFTGRYRVTGGSGTFTLRSINVFPL